MDLDEVCSYQASTIKMQAAALNAAREENLAPL